MNIETVIKSLADIRDQIKQAIADKEHVFLQDVKVGDRIITNTVPTGQLPNAAGFITTAIDNLQGHLTKAAEVAEANKKVQAP